jgi:NCS1 family nucleobase:cation symporter-1
MQLPFIFIHPSKLAWLFNAKALLVPIVCFGTLIWVSQLLLHRTEIELIV